jgi:acetyltransferase-like isoleucine patch superfamily enzyme
MGRKCFVDPGPAGLFELDGLEVGDECFILSPNVHGHFVDHGKLQLATVMLGRKARVNDGATIMPFTEIGDEVTLLTQCTTIKGSVLQKSGIYMGNTASIVESCIKDHDKNLILPPSLYSEPLTDANEVDLRIVLGVLRVFIVL